MPIPTKGLPIAAVYKMAVDLKTHNEREKWERKWKKPPWRSVVFGWIYEHPSLCDQMLLELYHSFQSLTISVVFRKVKRKKKEREKEIWMCYNGITKKTCKFTSKKACRFSCEKSTQKTFSQIVRGNKPKLWKRKTEEKTTVKKLFYAKILNEEEQMHQCLFWHWFCSYWKKIQKRHWENQMWRFLRDIWLSVAFWDERERETTCFGRDWEEIEAKTLTYSGNWLSPSTWSLWHIFYFFSCDKFFNN